MAWLANVDERWHEIAANYNERTRRMFRYYLSACAGGFRARHLQLWQMVFSREPPARYDAPQQLSRRQVRIVANFLQGPWKIAYFQETIPPQISTGRMFVR
ncbi:hypothetical protein NCCP2165_17240 [Halomonas sp. NCCP-2165]|nr:hypothetical protein NCCP2165_17240 [Halomonas sp. NCCP-2165]